MKIEFKPFDAKTVPLAGINLIEASAGTGKTYSIAILALRLIIENKIPIEKILMVTFTKAAVAELEERIRLFVRLAYRAAQNEIIEDQNIVDLLKNCKNTQETNLELLKKAILFLDETSILTIHSFCQQTLTEFAFETQQLFGVELLQDTNAVLQDEIDKFWREKITSIPIEIVNILLDLKLSRDYLNNIVKQHLNGKSFYVYQIDEDYKLENILKEEVLATFNSLSDLKKNQFESLEKYVVENHKFLFAAGQKNAYCQKNVLHLLSNPKSFLEFLWGKRDLVNIKKIYGNLLEDLEKWDNITVKINQLADIILKKITCHAINLVSNGIKTFMRRNNQMNFNDLIANLNAAILKPNNSKLIEGLRKKYEAVFIDEFQDTDRKQYEIFQNAFGKETIVFYIGDPKQSIYAFRTADIFTYFNAQNAADICYEMNVNFRSSSSYIQSMNSFFDQNNEFDAFHFQGSNQSINYIEVNSPPDNKKLNILNNSELEPPITIVSLNNNDLIDQAVAAQISHLLKPDSPYTIQSKSAILSQTVIQSEAKNLTSRKINPLDIGILVRTSKQAKKIQAQLSKLNIPSVTEKKDKIFNSDEAKYIYYFLTALIDINRSNINRALLSPFTGYNQKNIIELDIQLITELFKNYHTLFVNDGVFTAIKSFIAYFQTNSILQNSSSENGEKILSNLNQITELLHKAESNKKLSPVDLIHWLKRGIDGSVCEGDEYLQRIESDEEAVKIVTIHASKGLEYNIVFAPFLDLVDSEKNKRICDFRDPDTETYKSYTNYSVMNKNEQDQYDLQKNQEYSRLIYVALTRGVYKCFIYKSNYYKNSALNYFIDSLKEKDGLINKFDSFYEGKSLIFNESEKLIKNENTVRFELKQNYWRKMSYSYLKAPYQYFPKTRSNFKLNDYDNFIFSEMARGAKAGNLLHYIFENIQLSNENSWEKVIQNAITLYSIKDAANYKTMLPKMLQHILNSNISLSGLDFKLSDLDTQKCINEFEFDFSVSPFKVPQLKKLEEENLEIYLGSIYDLEGVMNGKIDLFFEHQGKYFVLDWKSNYLGDSLENYIPAALNQAMNESNYHLQYLIYCLASKKYLQSRLPHFNYETDFGGVIYLYVRGVREDSGTGIFVAKPSLQKMEMLEEILGGDKVLV